MGSNSASLMFFLAFFYHCSIYIYIEATYIWGNAAVATPVRGQKLGRRPPSGDVKYTPIKSPEAKKIKQEHDAQQVGSNMQLYYLLILVP